MSALAMRYLIVVAGDRELAHMLLSNAFD